MALSKAEEAAQGVVGSSQFERVVAAAEVHTCMKIEEAQYSGEQQQPLALAESSLVVGARVLRHVASGRSFRLH